MTGDGPEGDLQIRSASRFEAFYAAHRQAVAGYVRRRVGDNDAGDVIAQIFSVACRRFEAVPAPPQDRLWLFGVARRLSGRSASLDRTAAEAPPAPGCGTERAPRSTREL